MPSFCANAAANIEIASACALERTSNAKASPSAYMVHAIENKKRHSENVVEKFKIHMI